MSTQIRKVIERHHAFYEVMPYDVVVEQRPPGATATARRIQAGFDVNVYGSKSGNGSGPSPDYSLALAALQSVAAMIQPQTTDSSSVEVIPFASTLLIDTRRQFQEEAMLRIRITHSRGLDQPVGAPEQRALELVRLQLRDLGVQPTGRT